MQLPDPVFEIEEIVYHRVTGQKGLILGILYRKRDIIYEVCWDRIF